MEDGFFMTDAEKEEERLANKMADHRENGAMHAVSQNGHHHSPKQNGSSPSVSPYNLRHRDNRLLRNGHTH